MARHKFKRDLELEDQNAWAFQVSRSGKTKLLGWSAFPELCNDWLEADDADPRHPRPSPSVKTFWCRREAVAAKKFCLFKGARIVRVRVRVTVE